MSPNGRYVSFSSEATNLVPDDTNGGTDSFLVDTKTGTLSRISVDKHGNQGTYPGTGTENHTAVADDGSSLFHTIHPLLGLTVIEVYLFQGCSTSGKDGGSAFLPDSLPVSDLSGSF
jgi:hypothetical protein